MAYDFFYERSVASVTDPDSVGKSTRFSLSVAERDGAVVVGLAPEGERNVANSWRQVILSTVDAAEFLRAIQEAIRAAGTQPDGTPWHPTRVRDLPPSP